jgi:hypothetical protein
MGIWYPWPQCKDNRVKEQLQKDLVMVVAHTLPAEIVEGGGGLPSPVQEGANVSYPNWRKDVICHELEIFPFTKQI